ncbi:MAG: RecX family transcriptional regulator [Clostridia bacterium]|nr:RecX family transcriptional regulator [Clostridia bacterium]
MISLVSFTYTDGGDGVRIYAVRGDEKCTLTVCAEDFLELGIVKGDISDHDFLEIERAALYYKAYRTALRILSFGQCSEKRLYEKLRGRSFSHEASLFAAKKAAKGGYVDEKRQIESYVRTLVEKKLCGRRKILPYLLSRGYSADKINEVLDENYSDSDFKRTKKEFLLKTFGKCSPESREEAEEMKKALYKQGF